MKQNYQLAHVNNSNLQILQSMFNKLRQSFDPGKCLDPLAFLPFELAEMVMHHLEMRDRVYVQAM